MRFDTRTAAVVAFASAALSLGCGGGEKPAAEAPRTTMPPATLAPATTMPAAAAGDFGVAECDNYMKKYMACVESKVPEAQRVMMRQQLDATKAAWKQAAATPQGKASLASACTQMDAQTKPAMKAYGCTW
jgi:hypothetical protein